MNRPLSIKALWGCHIVCCALALLACVPILWPDVFLPDAWETRIIFYAGWVLTLSVGASLLLIAASSFLLLLRMRNLRAIVDLLKWMGLWLVCALLYSLLAALANVPLPTDSLADADIIQRTDKLYTPEDSLTGPDSLVIPVEPEHYPADELVSAPNLTLLSTKHQDILRDYVDNSHRWASYTADDTFYTKPGHVVVIPPRQGGIPGLVHVSFRRVMEGDPLPADYCIVKPGDPMPATPEGSEQVPDLAVDFGGSHYLLLAWRGTSHAETAHRALNAALAMVDDIVAPLAESPTPQTLQNMLVGLRRTTGDTPEILLSQPPAQYGVYQAEVYANPGEAGTLMLRIVNLEDGSTLRLFSSSARYSGNPAELFRHDYPDFTTRAFSVGYVPGQLPEKAPIFTIRQGEAHQFFGVACEVVFKPIEPSRPTRVILRRCYRVQAYEDPNAPIEEPRTEDETPTVAPTEEPAPPPVPEQDSPAPVEPHPSPAPNPELKKFSPLPIPPPRPVTNASDATSAMLSITITLNPFLLPTE